MLDGENRQISAEVPRHLFCGDHFCSPPVQQPHKIFYCNFHAKTRHFIFAEITDSGVLSTRELRGVLTVFLKGLDWVVKVAGVRQARVHIVNIVDEHDDSRDLDVSGGQQFPKYWWRVELQPAGREQSEVACQNRLGPLVRFNESGNRYSKSTLPVIENSVAV